MQNQKTSLILDQWQNEAIAEKGNLAICSGRQIGKSTCISIRAGKSAMENPRTSILIISAVERQALLLFEKVLSYIYETNKSLIKKGTDRPTKHELKLKNGSVIRCLPTGLSGYGIRGYTINDLYADEAHFISEDVWAAVTPMLATTGGRINLLSTADLSKGKSGYFYRCSMDKDFKFMSLNTIEVAEGRQEPQRSAMLNHIEKERGRMSKAQFGAEYMGKFVDAMLQFFSNEWIEKVCCLEETPKIEDKFLGVDIAGMGKDQSAFEGLGTIGDLLKQFLHEITTKTRTTETEQKIIGLNTNHDFNKIGIDDGGMGVGVYDHLLKTDETRRKVIALNNAKRVIDADGRKKKLLKEDMYYNLLAIGDRGELQLFNNDEIKASLRSIHEAEDGKIFGQNSHITEALIRAAYVAKDKHLNIWVDYI